jgi:hypothetical protein
MDEDGPFGRRHEDMSSKLVDMAKTIEIDKDKDKDMEVIVEVVEVGHGPFDVLDYRCRHRRV